MSRLVDIQSIYDGASNVIDLSTKLQYNSQALLTEALAASTANGEGAALVGVEDSAANFTATTVEGVLAELQTNIDAVNLDGLQYATTTVTHDGGATQSIGTIPLNAVITDVRVVVTTTFDGTTPNCTIGNTNDGVTTLADSDDFDLTLAGVQQKLEWQVNGNAASDWSVFLTVSGATQGQAEVIFFYTQP